jgi:hypothetical protein
MLHRQPAHAVNYRSIGVARLMQQKWKQAEEPWQKAISLQPNLAKKKAILALGDVVEVEVAVAHDEDGAAGGRDVAQWIAVKGDNVGVIACG